MMLTCASVRSTSSEDCIGGSGACVLQLRRGEEIVTTITLNGVTIVNLAFPVKFDNAVLIMGTSPKASRGTILSYAKPGGMGPSTILVERPIPSRFNRTDPI